MMKKLANLMIVVAASLAAQTVTIPAGTVIAVRTVDAIDSKDATARATFKGTVDDAVLIDGKVVIPKSANAVLRLDGVTQSGKFKGHTELRLVLASVQVNGKSIEVQTGEVVSSSGSQGKNTAAKAGAGAAAGAILGGILGGGKGAAQGAAIGGGAGAGSQVFTQGKSVKVPSETRLSFPLTQPVTLP